MEGMEGMEGWFENKKRRVKKKSSLSIDRCHTDPPPSTTLHPTYTPHMSNPPRQPSTPTYYGGTQPSTPSKYII